MPNPCAAHAPRSRPLRENQALSHHLRLRTFEMSTRTTATARKSPAKKARTTKPATPRLSRMRRPPELEVVDWQTELRRQFGREQNFGLENMGSEPVFSDFRVINPSSGTRYRVAIRGLAPGHNFCTCLDYATNDLGTCKHIEFTLAKLQAKRGAKAAFAKGFQPSYSEVWLDYAGERQVRFALVRTAQPPCYSVRKHCLMPTRAGPCAGISKARWSTCCKPRRSAATNCVAVTMSGNSSPRCATASAAKWS